MNVEPICGAAGSGFIMPEEAPATSFTGMPGIAGCVTTAGAIETGCSQHPTHTNCFNGHFNQSINESNLVFVKCRLNKVLRGASYE